MKQFAHLSCICFLTLVLTACVDQTSGMACLGTNNDTLVENIQQHCKKGDTIATKFPAYFCDFNYSVAYNDYNSAFCIYNGSQRKERINN